MKKQLFWPVAILVIALVSPTLATTAPTSADIWLKTMELKLQADATAIDNYGYSGNLRIIEEMIAEDFSVIQRAKAKGAQVAKAEAAFKKRVTAARERLLKKAVADLEAYASGKGGDTTLPAQEVLERSENEIKRLKALGIDTRMAEKQLPRLRKEVRIREARVWLATCDAKINGYALPVVGLPDLSAGAAFLSAQEKIMAAKNEGANVSDLQNRLDMLLPDVKLAELNDQFSRLKDFVEKKRVSDFYDGAYLVGAVEKLLLELNHLGVDVGEQTEAFYRLKPVALAGFADYQLDKLQAAVMNPLPAAPSIYNANEADIKSLAYRAEMAVETAEAVNGHNPETIKLLKARLETLANYQPTGWWQTFKRGLTKNLGF